MARSIVRFVTTVTLALVKGSRAYYLWMALLAAVALGGALAFFVQVHVGLAVTAMTDQVSWGAYIANFTFAVGLTDAAVIVSIPGFIYRKRPLQQVIWIALYLALSAIVMAGLFVLVDIGRPERGWHMFPILGALNFPTSMLSWDVLILSVYLAVSGTLVFYALFTWSRGGSIAGRTTTVWILATTVLAVGLHTVTAFLYTWLGARPFWNAAIVAPRFLASAFVVGPAFLIGALQVIRRTTRFEFDDDVLHVLRRIVTVSLLLNLFLLFAEVFKEFKTESLHMSSAVYLFLGLEGHTLLVPYIWASVVLNVGAAIILVTPTLSHRPAVFNAALLMAFIGIWIEKGMGLVVPGFVPSPLGDIVDYTPSLVEIAVCAGVWAIGMLVFTALTKVGIQLQLGVLGGPVRTSEESP